MPEPDPTARDTLEDDEPAAMLWYELVDSLIDEGHSVHAAVEIAGVLLKIRAAEDAC